jgi:hypothetical protein
VLISKRADGDFDLRLGAVERRLLTDVCAELRGMIDGRDDDPLLRRLFPTAYADDAEHEAFYQQMAHDELRDRKIAALETVERTAGNDTVTAGDLDQWLMAVNAVRLALGTRLDVSEDWGPEDVDEDDPDFPAHVVYDYLGRLLDSIVREMSRA